MITFTLILTIFIIASIIVAELSVGELNEDWFLTREEAEKKLKEFKGEE